MKTNTWLLLGILIVLLNMAGVSPITVEGFCILIFAGGLIYGLSNLLVTFARETKNHEPLSHRR